MTADHPDTQDSPVLYQRPPEPPKRRRRWDWLPDAGILTVALVLLGGVIAAGVIGVGTDAALRVVVHRYDHRQVAKNPATPRVAPGRRLVPAGTPSAVVSLSPVALRTRRAAASVLRSSAAVRPVAASSAPPRPAPSISAQPTRASSAPSTSAPPSPTPTPTPSPTPTPTPTPSATATAS